MKAVAGPVGRQHRVSCDTALRMGCQEHEDIKLVRRQTEILTS